MDRCRLKGALGDALNAVVVSAGHKIRLLLGAMAALLRRLLGRLLVVIGAGIQEQDKPSMRAAAQRVMEERLPYNKRAQP